ncbi:MAG: sigma-70 family RNA polymerase sigma factor [Clostridiaceae bacterium]
MIEIEIKDLILKVQDNKRAFDEIMEIYSPSIYKLSIRLCKNKFDADDLFQITWLKIFKNLEKYNCNNSFENWIYTICLNNYRDKYTKEKKLIGKVKTLFSSTQEKDEELNKINDPSKCVDNLIISKIDSSKIRQYVNELPDIYRVPIILYYFKDLSYKDISKILTVPVGTIKSRLNMAKTKLKKMMEDDDG